MIGAQPPTVCVVIGRSQTFRTSDGEAATAIASLNSPAQRLLGLLGAYELALDVFDSQQRRKGPH